MCNTGCPQFHPQFLHMACSIQNPGIEGNTGGCAGFIPSLWDMRGLLGESLCGRHVSACRGVSQAPGGVSCSKHCPLLPQQPHQYHDAGERSVGSALVARRIPWTDPALALGPTSAPAADRDPI
jgi:hypothetical protein